MKKKLARPPYGGLSITSGGTLFNRHPVHFCPADYSSASSNLSLSIESAYLML